jgi:hypothetical protein
MMDGRTQSEGSDRTLAAPNTMRPFARSTPTRASKRRGGRETAQQLSGRNRSHCRPATGTASPTCQPPTGATVSSMYRDSTSQHRDGYVESGYVRVTTQKPPPSFVTLTSVYASGR